MEPLICLPNIKMINKTTNMSIEGVEGGEEEEYPPPLTKPIINISAGTHSQVEITTAGPYITQLVTHIYILYFLYKIFIQTLDAIV